MPPGNGKGNGNGGGSGQSNEFILWGNNIVSDASVSQNNNGGANGEGQVSITNGDMPFEDDDIIVIVADDVAANGAITHSSSITEIIVYDSYDDYLAGVELYTYESNNPNGAPIGGGTKHLGDTYVNFNGGAFSTDDPDAPDIGHLFIAAGTDMGVAADGGTVTIDTVTDIDYDGDGTIDTGTEEEGDGNFSDENNGLLFVCFVRGTLIETPDGPRFIESLRPGDLVTTLDDGPQPIRWIGHRKIDGTGDHAPILFRPGALRNHRNLRVSPNHRMMVTGAMAELMFGIDEVLVAAKHLVNDLTICRAPCKEVDYYHLLLDDHQLLFAEGAPSESLYLGEMAKGALDEEAMTEIETLFPELLSTMASGIYGLSRVEIRGAEARAMRLAG